MPDLTPARRKALEAQLNRVLESRPFRSREIHRNMLDHCAKATMDGRIGDLTQGKLRAAVWKDRTAFPVDDTSVRGAATGLRHALDEYYQTEGRSDPIRISMARRGYAIEWIFRRPFPTARIEGAAQPEISLPEFKQFLLAMCEPEGITAQERNERTKVWAAADQFAAMNLRERREFDDFFQQLSSRLTLAQMRSLTKVLGIHPLMLDPLLSQTHVGDFLQLKLEDFIQPEKPTDDSYGSDARYAVPRFRFPGTNANFVYLELDPEGKSDIHHHPGDELMLVLDGQIELRLHDSGLRIVLRRGELIHFHAEQTHSAINRSDVDPAHMLIIRFYQIAPNPSSFAPPTRQQMRRDLRDALGGKGKLTSPTKGWALQALAGRSPRESTKEQRPEFIEDRFGLARMIRLLPKPQSIAQRRFLNTVNAVMQKNYRKLEDFLSDLEIGEPKTSRLILERLSVLYKSVYDMLFLQFFFPAVAGAMVFRPGEDEEDGVNAATLTDPNKIPQRVSYVIPLRNLVCSDIAMAHLTLHKGRGTLWNHHPGYELLVPLEGSAQIEMSTPGAKPHRVSAEEGLLAHYRSDKEHRVYNPSKTSSAHLLVIRFYGETRPQSRPQRRPSPKAHPKN